METFTRRFGIGLVAMLAAVCWIWAGFAAIQFSLITVIVALGLSLTCFYLISVLRASKDVSVQTSFDGAGTVIRPDVRITKNMHRLLVTGTLSMGLMFAAWVIGVLYLPLGDVRHVFPIAFGAAAVPMAWLWLKDSTQGGLSYLFLGPDGIEFAGFIAPKSAKWEDVKSIADKLPNEERFWNPMVVTLKNGKNLLMEAPGTYTPKGTALIEMVRFYWQHPEQRDELTDGRALQHLPIPQTNRPEL